MSKKKKCMCEKPHVYNLVSLKSFNCNDCIFVLQFSPMFKLFGVSDTVPLLPGVGHFENCRM